MFQDCFLAPRTVLGPCFSAPEEVGVEPLRLGQYRVLSVLSSRSS